MATYTYRFSKKSETISLSNNSPNHYYKISEDDSTVHSKVGAFGKLNSVYLYVYAACNTAADKYGLIVRVANSSSDRNNSVDPIFNKQNVAGGTGKNSTDFNVGSSDYYKTSAIDVTSWFNSQNSNSGKATSDYSSKYIRVTGNTSAIASYTWATYCELVFDYTEHSHSYNSGVITTQPTCTTAGVKTYTCTVCGATKTETITKKSHSYTGAIKSDGNGKDATHSFKCVNGCNQYGGAVKHTWNSGTVTKQPTCTATGERTYTCTASGCGATYTEGISKKPHTEVTIPAVAATCTSTGLTEGKKCSVCNTILVAQQTVPALGHSYTSTVVAPTENSHGYTRHTCSRCGDYYDDTYTYLVRWYNEDGSVLLETDPSVPHGTMPNCSVTPTKSATAQYSYTHIGWAISPTAENTTSLTAVVANVKYYARFTPTVNKYTVTWKNDDGTVLEPDTLVPYGTPPDYNGATPTKASTSQYHYTFLGWSAKVEDPPLEEGDLPTVSGNITYTAVYLPVVRKYDLDIIAYDCIVTGVISGTYEYGKEFTVTIEPHFGFESDKISVYEGISPYPVVYEGRELTFVLMDDTTIVCSCKRALAPLFASREQQVKDVYIVPAINTIVYVVEGSLPTLTTTMHTVDDLHFSVINTTMGNSVYESYEYYPIDKLFVNDEDGRVTRIW